MKCKAAGDSSMAYIAIKYDFTKCKKFKIKKKDEEPKYIQIH